MTEKSASSLRFAAAAILPSILGTIAIYIAVAIFAQYSWPLFICLPIAIGFMAAVIYSPRGERSFWKCLLAGLAPILIIGVILLVTAVEGLICLAMVVPLAVPLIAVGTGLGYTVTTLERSDRTGVKLSILLFLASPLLMGFEASQKSTPTVHEVISVVEIDAPIDVVWKNVVEFPSIDKAPEGILKLGFAYPTDARIDGFGVGAIRYCNFNTGPFVEPITEWQEPHLLAFDVKEQPAPMTELTFYDELHAAHLDYFRSQRGEFRLYEKDGKTVVVGSTFYTHNISPDFYWKLYSDEIIHRIHLRVLEHIKEVSERERHP